jgi:hypothetical protein
MTINPHPLKPHACAASYGPYPYRGNTMKIHSLKGLKAKAQSSYIDLVTGTVAHRVPGITVRQEDTSISCLYDPYADTFTWYMNGMPVTERTAAAQLRVISEPEYGTEESFAKFDAWHIAQLPVVATYVQTEGREKCETLVRLGEQWGVLYSGTEGYLRAQDMLGKHPDEGKRTFLIQKLDSIESALLDIAEKFVAEYQRLGLTVLREAEHA